MSKEEYNMAEEMREHLEKLELQREAKKEKFNTTYALIMDRFFQERSNG